MKSGFIKLYALILIILFSILISGCKNWEYNAVKKGIYFTKISQSKSGTIIGYMSENHEIQGFPCEKGWIHFTDNWDLRSFQLSTEFTFNNTQLPAHTWIHFPYHESQIGYILSLPYDYEIQGYLCGGSGGYKGTHTGFYEDGRLRSFYPPDDVTVGGVPCKSTPFVNVNLYEDGTIKSCKLAEEYQVDGRLFKKGASIEFDENGKVK